MVVCVRDDEESPPLVLPSHELECCVLATALPKKCVPLTSTACCCCCDELLLVLSMLAPSADATPVEEEDFGVGANPRPGRHSLAFKDNSLTESAISSIILYSV